MFDLYGEMLTKSQKKMLYKHYFLDNSLSEIAEDEKISRQAVLDSINKAIKKLEKMEEDLHLSFIKQNILKLQGTKNDQVLLENIKKYL